MEQEQSAAEKTNFLEERIKQNQSNQSLDLNEWAFSRIEEFNVEMEILELCCGTGKQTKYLAKKFPKSRITAVDISTDAIKKVQSSDFFNLSRIKTIVSGMDEFLVANTQKFDIVFVSYGLYYAKNLDQVITQIIEQLNLDGKFIVLGPYGNNNKSLFDLVRDSGVEIDHFVIYSCTDFMHDKVIHLSLSNFQRYTIDTAINLVQWKSASDVLSYWKNTTFYDEKREGIFTKKLDAHFSSYESFNIEKHIMLFQGIKKL